MFVLLLLMFYVYLDHYCGDWGASLRRAVPEILRLVCCIAERSVIQQIRTATECSGRIRYFTVMAHLVPHVLDGLHVTCSKDYKTRQRKRSPQDRERASQSLQVLRRVPAYCSYSVASFYNRSNT